MNQPRTTVGLSDILSVVKSPDLVWRMTFLHAFGRPGNTLDLLELEQRVEESELGVQFSRSELQFVADQLWQVVDTDVSGYAQGHRDAPPVEAVAVLEAFDSSEWNLVFDEAVVQLDHQRLTALGAQPRSD